MWAKGSSYYTRHGPEFCDLVREMSGGRLDITPYGPGEIAGVLEYGDVLAKGTFEMAQWHSGYWAGKDLGLGYIGYMPGSPMDYWQYNYWFWEEGGVELAREFYDTVGIYYIGNQGYADLEPIFSKVPIYSVEDLKGLKMRSSGIALSLYEKMGVSVVALGGEAVYEALARGTIDCVEHTPAKMMMDIGIHEVTDYVIEPWFHQPYTSVNYLANRKPWDSLPSDLQAIVFAATRQTSERFQNETHREELEAKELLLAKGMEFIWLSDEEQEKQIEIARELWKDSAKKSPYAAKVLKSQTDYLKKIGLLPADYTL